MKTIKTPCKKLLIEKYPFVADQDALLKRMNTHRINFTLQLQTLCIYIFTEYIDTTNTDCFDVSMCWCNETMENAVHKTFDYNLDGFEAVCNWIDTQRINFAKQLL